MPLTGASADPDLTPEFPGITDKLTLATWDPPFPYDNSRIKPARRPLLAQLPHDAQGLRDAQTGQELWGSRFGNLTSVRLAAPDGNLDAASTAFRARLARTPVAGAAGWSSTRSRPTP